MNDPRFQDIQIYRENGGDGQVFLKSYWCSSEEDYHNFIKYCNQRINNPHKNVLKLIGFTQSSENQLCGDFSKITGYYEYYSHNLERELDRRHTRSEFFNEQEIWFLLESIVSVGAFLEGKNLHQYIQQNVQQIIFLNSAQNKVHGDIRPNNIFLTNEGFVKLADPQLVRDEKNAYIKAFQYGEQTYLSPQLMKALQNREIQPTHNQVKSDVFSLGMTMLEVCCLYTARSCYDYGQYQIIRPVIDDLLQRSRGRYSNFLINILSEMVLENEGQRPSFLELQQILQPYQDQIQNLQPFNPDPRQSQFGSQAGLVQQIPQQNQYLVQSQISHQPLVGQSQILQHQPQSQIVTTQPYITSPNRTYQTVNGNVQGSQVLYQTTSYPQQQYISQQPQQQVYQVNQNQLDTSQQLQQQPQYQQQQQPQYSYISQQPQVQTYQYQQPQAQVYSNQQQSKISQNSPNTIQQSSHHNGNSGFDSLDQKVNNALQSNQDVIQNHSTNLQYQSQQPQQQYQSVQPQPQQYQQYPQQQQIYVQPQQYYQPHQ
ncbi:Protein kinase-like domain [Pseudocohnilembus persalinus]|uniref:non-specific serine/threonine protein kinase n=1 Tax=Pseudocohnilembus persalinus TaxID=266149 RepID=A0A0V0QQY7_PSEPJ|nr:Protein kinase-like domain [Pseudocohnilembus persalinus]|eukprot:KRX04683.1 Protein kinase-like domain [Pseudocohnilembus persalinus]